jgi:hypothetical protein
MNQVTISESTESRKCRILKIIGMLKCMFL